MNTIEQYHKFLHNKTHLTGSFGFEPIFMPDMLFDFQVNMTTWAINKGRAAIFADCGLGKTFMQLTWAQNVIQKTNGKVLVLTPLAVGQQTVLEANKLGVEAYRSMDGKHEGHKLVITNYERLHYFDANDFVGVVCDESSILKNFDGKIKSMVTDFMRKLPYRLLCTATAAPNDFIELGTSSEALGHMGYMDMLGKFFKKAETTMSRKDENRSGIYRFRGHAERDFWRWICSWARAIKKPSDIGGDDSGYVLPELITNQHVIESVLPPDGFLFSMPAHGLAEQRAERSRTTKERCQKAADICNSHDDFTISWCYLNKESDMLEKMIDGAIAISGDDSDERKEEIFTAFSTGQLKKLITKPKIAGMGLNWQHCNHQTFFPSHSFEQMYQSVRRCWRFGQKRPVTVDMITSEGERDVIINLRRKAEASDKLFSKLVSLMNNELAIEKKQNNNTKEQLPSWL
jgi:hypothetical protein